MLAQILCYVLYSGIVHLRYYLTELVSSELFIEILALQIRFHLAGFGIVIAYRFQFSGYFLIRIVDKFVKMQSVVLAAAFPYALKQTAVPLM